jgi:hypothetical protein
MNKKNILKISILFAVIGAAMSCEKKTATQDTNSTFRLVQDSLQGTISDGIVVLKANQVYKLIGPLSVASGATLKIEEGAQIIGQTAFGSSNLYINILRGGKIDAQGTATNPIIFTSSDNLPGGWGGICIHGYAPNNVGNDAASEINGVQYGGTVSTDNSGTMKYVVIKYSGAKNGTKEFNGLSMFSVGSGTQISYIAVLNGNDDAFEWYGGTNNCSFLYAENNDDDNFDWDLGYSGNLNALYSINTNTNASSDSRGIEADGNPDNNAATPFTNPTVNEVTLIGRGTTFAGTQLQGIYLRRGVKGKITNVFVKGYKIGVGVEHDLTLAAMTAGDLKVSTIQFDDVTTKTSGKTSAGVPAVTTSVIVEGTATGAGSTTATKPSWAGFIK